MDAPIREGGSNRNLLKLHKVVGTPEDRRYSYGSTGNQDIVFYVEEDKLQAIGNRLDKLGFVLSYNVGDPIEE